MAELGGENILEILFLTFLVKQVVYIDKFKLFDPRVVRVKKFEFAWVNHELDKRGQNQNLLPICPSNLAVGSFMSHIVLN